MKKNIIIGSIVIILFLITGLVIYKSNALYKTSDTHNFINSKVNVFVSKDFAYTGNSQEFITPRTGYYKIELWGASGGTIENVITSGYTTGTIFLNKGEILYFYVGKSGAIGSYGINASNTIGKGASATFNGGGKGGNAGGGAYPYSSYIGGSSGGGATDVRLVNGVWNNSISLRSRIMVAGGSGGIGGVDPSISRRGKNLSFIGENGAGIHTAPYYLYIDNSGFGAKQTSGGAKGNSTATSVGGSSGQFGIAGNGDNSGITTFCNGHCGGGGGYYGGGGAGNTTSDCFSIGGGGGSSYISGYAGSNSVLETGGTVAQPNHTNNTIHYSGKYFINSLMMSAYYQGDGKAKITYLANTPARTNTKLNNVRYIKSCLNGSNVNAGDYWVELQAIKDGKNLALGKIPTGTVAEADSINLSYKFITDGKIDNITGSSGFGGPTIQGLQCITIDLGVSYNLDEIALWNFYRDGRIFYQNTLSVGAANTTGTAPLSTILHTYSGTSGYAETSNGKRYSAWN